MSQDWIDVQIKERKTIAGDVVSLVLVPTTSIPLPAFTAGAHIDVKLPNYLVRQYSLCNNPKEEGSYQIAVLLEPRSRGGSEAVHALLREGAILQISSPRNHFPLLVAKRSLLFAGGIGVTPLLAMAWELTNNKADFEIHYCNRTEAKAAFKDVFGAFPFDGKAYLHFDDGSEEQKLNIVDILARSPKDAHLYVCGPTGFMDFVIASAKSCGWAAANIHFEYFSAASLNNVDNASDTDFTVKIASSGAMIEVKKHQTIIAALIENGVDIPVSCEQGICGTCATRILEGIPDHRDMFLSNDEKARNDQILPCCSRSKSDVLVLDL